MQEALILLRGVPGSGKSTLAQLLSESGRYPIFSIDDYFTDAATGNYNFNYKENHLAYAQCQAHTESAMKQRHKKIIVHNTFVFDWEFEPYFELARRYNYLVFSVVVENFHGHKNTHQISDEDVAKMAARFQVKLY